MQENIYYKEKKRFRIWPVSNWARWIIIFLIGLLFIFGIYAAIQKGTSRFIISLLLKERVPFEAILLEGAPGYSQPQRERLNEVRRNTLSLSMFFLTGVNISDARTFFLSYFKPPLQGPAWLNWAYFPNDPELEGPILEPLNSVDPPENKDSPVLTPAGKQDILVGIYHTHNSESYVGDGGPEHTPGENGDIVKVGETLKGYLEKNGVRAVHSTTIHDAKDFMKAYSKSLETANQLLKNNPSIRVLLDIHRDGLPPGVSRTTVNINGKEMSRILFVIGKKNPHWEKNEQIAEELIEIGEKKFPGLFVTNISYASDARYNQHLSDGALLIEIGSQLNSLQEANRTAEALAQVLAEWFKNNQ